jgi:hypothetical protein
MLQLATQYSDDVITIWCKGRIVLGDDLLRLRDATLLQNTPEVILDLSSVNLIDAAGLGRKRWSELVQLFMTTLAVAAGVVVSSAGVLIDSAFSSRRKSREHQRRRCLGRGSSKP